ncbi:MAG: hypothetical protein AAGF66_10430 [Cyanobacteria bacterium P01_H01_bin.119]
MDPQHRAKEEELRRREEVLKARELQIRMRELESEISPTPVSPTRKHKEPLKKASWFKKLVLAGKFLLIVLAVMVTVRVAAWLATGILVLAVAWVGYKVLFGSDES